MVVLLKNIVVYGHKKKRKRVWSQNDSLGALLLWWLLYINSEVNRFEALCKSFHMELFTDRNA